MTGQAYPIEFAPFSVGPLTLKNRVVVPPMCTNTADENGFVTQKTLEHYGALARGGCGLVIVESSCIRSPQGKGGLLRMVIDDDKYLPGLERLAKVIHQNGAGAIIQLQHSGRDSICQKMTGEAPVAPSVIAATHGGKTRELTIEEIHELCELWGKAAIRAKKAEFDGVEVHAASNNLLAQFQSSFWNKRNDVYGGEIRNRGRFLEEVLLAIKSAVGPNFPFWARINVREFGPTAGVTEVEGKALAAMTESVGACAVSVTSFGGGLYGRVPPMGVPKGNMLPIAEVIKKVVKVPVMVAGRLDPAQGEKAINEGKTDLICIGRSILADPDLTRKYAECHPEDVMPCIACGHCIDMTRTSNPVQCTVNPALGLNEAAIIRASKGKKVLIVGGGPAGMEAARVAAMRGHNVTLYEKEEKLGGQLNLAVIPPFKRPLEELLQNLTSQMKRLGVKVELGREATLTAVKHFNPDAVVVATGAKPFLPPVPIRGSKSVAQAIDVLSGKAKVGNVIVLIGGELVGCETAEYLVDRGVKVTIVRRGPEMATKVPPAERTSFIERLKNKGVTLICQVTSYEEINEIGLAFNINGEKKVIPADTVVLAAGARPDFSLLDSLKRELSHVVPVGDLVGPGNIRSAIRDGYSAAMDL